VQGASTIDGIIQAVARNNDPPIPSTQILSFPNGSLIDEYLYEHPNTAIAAVEFVQDNPESIGFSIQTNSSVQWFKGQFSDANLYAALPVQVAVEREIVRTLGQRPDLGWAVDITQFPHPSAKVCLPRAIPADSASLTDLELNVPLPYLVQSPSTVAKFAPTFIFASLMFQFVLQLHDVVHEKESGVKRLLKVMGLR